MHILYKDVVKTPPLNVQLGNQWELGEPFLVETFIRVQQPCFRGLVSLHHDTDPLHEMHNVLWA